MRRRNSMSDREQNRRDQALAGCWKLLLHSDPGRPTGRRGEKEQAATSILYGELLVTYRADPKRWVSYSRRKEFYARRTRYEPKSLTYTNVMRFVDREVERKFIENKSSSPRQRGTQSRIMAVPAWSFAHLRLLSCAMQTRDSSITPTIPRPDAFVLICLRSMMLWPQPS